MTYHHLAPDDDGAQALFYDDGLYGDDPLLIASRNAVTAAQWDLMVRGAGLDEPRFVTEDPWRWVDRCTCAAEFIGPGGHESYCGWVEAS